MKYYYVEEFCGKYRQLMPVAYDKNESGEYHKTDMACNSKGAECSLDSCKHFQKAPDILEVNKLRDVKTN